MFACPNILCFVSATDVNNIYVIERFDLVAAVQWREDIFLICYSAFDVGITCKCFFKFVFEVYTCLSIRLKSAATDNLSSNANLIDVRTCLNQHASTPVS